MPPILGDRIAARRPLALVLLALAIALPAGGLVPVPTYTAQAAPLVVITTADSGPGSLRQAILDANGTPAADTITFSIPGPGPYSIVLSSALPNISTPMTIDGTSQTGFAGSPLIELVGTNAGPSANGLNLTGGTSTIKGLVINRFAGDGVSFAGSAGAGTTIVGNYIGTDVTGTIARPNNNGIRMLGGSGTANNNIIGGTTDAARNVISGNTGFGLVTGRSGNVIQGNYFGIDSTGTAALGNGFGGINIAGDNNTIGGTAPGAGNVVSGNLATGLSVSGTSPIVRGNIIGADKTGTRALGNTGFGLQLAFTDGATVVGNVIAANGLGLELLNATAPVVQGNRIGVGSAALLPAGVWEQGVFDALCSGLGNRGAGMRVRFSPSSSAVTAIGGDTTAQGNVIACNDGAGIWVDPTASNTVFLSNSIFQNDWLDVDVGGNGPTYNTAGGAGNSPFLTGASSPRGSVTIHGTHQAAPSTAYRVQFFADVECHVTGYGGARTFLGQTTVTTNAAGTAALDFTVSAPVIPGNVVSASATRLNAGIQTQTSELSPCVTVTSSEPGGPRTGDVISFFTQQPDGTFGSTAGYQIPGLEYYRGPALVTDLDGDGVQNDLILADAGTGQVFAIRNVGRSVAPVSARDFGNGDPTFINVDLRLQFPGSRVRFAGEIGFKGPLHHALGDSDYALLVVVTPPTGPPFTQLIIMHSDEDGDFRIFQQISLAPGSNGLHHGALDLPEWSDPTGVFKNTIEFNEQEGRFELRHGSPVASLVGALVEGIPNPDDPEIPDVGIYTFPGVDGPISPAKFVVFGADSPMFAELVPPEVLGVTAQVIAPDCPPPGIAPAGIGSICRQFAETVLYLVTKALPPATSSPALSSYTITVSNMGSISPPSGPATLPMTYPTAAAVPNPAVIPQVVTPQNQSQSTTLFIPALPGSVAAVNAGSVTNRGLQRVASAIGSITTLVCGTSGPSALAVGDFNGDGREDLLVTGCVGDDGIPPPPPTAAITSTATRTALTTPAATPTPSPTRTTTPTPGPVAGRGFTLQSGPGVSPSGGVGGQALLNRVLSWQLGTLTPSLLLRWSSQHGFTFPSLLTPGANIFTDTQPLADSIYCYLLVAYLGDVAAPSVQALSDFLCVYPNTNTGPNPPGQFRVRLNESSQATLQWLAPGGQDRYDLTTTRFDGSSLPTRSFTADRLEFSEAIPAATCYRLVAFAGATQLGGTDTLCAVPGLTSFAATTLPRQVRG